MKYNPPEKRIPCYKWSYGKWILTEYLIENETLRTAVNKSKKQT